MRESIYSKNEIFKKCYDKICSLINEGVDVEDLPSKLESEYLKSEIKVFINDLGSVKYFKKVDKIQIVYRILSIIVLFQFFINSLMVVFFASFANDSTSANIDFNYFSMSVFYSLIGLLLSILLVVNSFFENIVSTIIVLISFLFFSQVYNDAFIIFNITSIFYWAPILLFISTFLFTIRLAHPKRERMLKLLNRLKKNNIAITSISEVLSEHSKLIDKLSLFKSFGKVPESKELFKNLTYKVKKNPTENDLLKWVGKKKRNNIILLKGVETDFSFIENLMSLYLFLVF